MAKYRLPQVRSVCRDRLTLREPHNTRNDFMIACTKVSPAEVEKYLKGVDYPLSKADLVKHVKQEMQQILEILQQLPDETFQRPTDVAKALGEVDRESKSSH